VESTLSLHGLHKDSVKTPCRVHVESVWSPYGLHEGCLPYSFNEKKFKSYMKLSVHSESQTWDLSVIVKRHANQLS
jgi:hypothetical protein